MADPQLSNSITEFFRRTGSKGGNRRAALHSKEELSRWGKLGGRPKGTARKRKQQGGE